MAPYTLSTLFAVASASYAAAQAIDFPATPLNQLSFPKPTDAPYQIYPATGIQYTRGPQTGYNICNSTTEGPTSLCQTMYVNGLDGKRLCHLAPFAFVSSPLLRRFLPLGPGYPQLQHC
jgi:hypothetical protein